MNRTASAQNMNAGPPADSGRTGRRWLLPLCVAVCATTARAEVVSGESGVQVWINPGIYSQHFDSGKGLRNDNIGLGVELLLTRDHALMGGNFINSNGARTRYAAYEWRALHRQFAGIDAGAGIALGAFDGYPNYRNGAWFVAPLPMLFIEGRTFGANISLIPTVANRFDGALAIQIRLRVW